MRKDRVWSAMVIAALLIMMGPAARAAAEPETASGDYVIISPKKLPARIDSSQEIFVSVGDNMVTVRAVFAYKIRNSGLVSLSIPVPERYRVTGVEGDQIKEAKVAAGVLLITLKDAVKDGYRLTVTLEKARESAGGDEPIPEVRTLEAASEAGWMAVAVAPGMEVEVKGLTALRSADPAELPASMTGGAPALLAFRFDRHPVSGTLTMTRRDQLTSLNASIDTINLVTVITAEGRSITRVIYEVRNNMKQSLEIALPAGAKVWSAFVNERPVTVATDGKDRVFIPLLAASGPRTGTVTVELSYYLALSKLEKTGQIKTIFPQADLPASEMMASIYLPFKYKYGDFKGTMEKIEDGLEQLHGAGPLSLLSIPPDAGAPRDRRGDKKNVNSDFANVRQDAMEVEIAEQVRSGKIQNMIANLDPQDANKLTSLGYLAAGSTSRDDSLSGLLPVKFSVPLRGSVYRFTKLVVVDEAPEMSFTYKKLRAPIPWNQVFWAAKIAAAVLVTLLLLVIIHRLWKRPSGKGDQSVPAAPSPIEAEAAPVPGT